MTQLKIYLVECRVSFPRVFYTTIENNFGISSSLKGGKGRKVFSESSERNN